MPLPSLRRRRLLISPLVLAALRTLPAHAEDDLKSVVDRADQIRFPDKGFQVDVSVTSVWPDKDPEVRKYRILSKGNDSTIVIKTEPASDSGQKLLMKERDLWIFLPDISQPIRLQLKDRLTGEVSNGDLARANFGGDYNAKMLRTDTIDGDAYLVLELIAVDGGVTYHRVVYWVRQADSRPYKAEFYALSNRLLKTCRYLDYRQVAGAMRPTKLVMEDGLKEKQQSILEYSNMKLRELPDKVFTKDYLKKLE